MHPETGTTGSRAIGALFAATLAIALAYASAFLPGGAPRWAPWLLATGTATCMVGMMVLGATRRGRPLGRTLVAAFAVTFVLVLGGFALALALPAEAAGARLWLGLPRRAAILLYGIGLLPLLILPLAYASTFDEQTLSEEDLARLRAAAAALRPVAPPPADAIAPSAQRRPAAVLAGAGE